jgi:hypothetical protein
MQQNCSKEIRGNLTSNFKERNYRKNFATPTKFRAYHGASSTLRSHRPFDTLKIVLLPDTDYLDNIGLRVQER